MRAISDVVVTICRGASLCAKLLYTKLSVGGVVVIATGGLACSLPIAYKAIQKRAAPSIDESTVNKSEDGEEYKKPPKPYPIPHVFDLKELSFFNGKSDKFTRKPIYCALAGKVFDISSNKDGRAYFGPDGRYSMFAGKEITVALARSKHNMEVLNMLPTEWVNFNQLEKEMLSSWIEKFESSYDFVGYVSFDDEESDALFKKNNFLDDNYRTLDWELVNNGDSQLKF